MPITDTHLLNCCCSRSLAKLMHSCSKEFSLKHSKPYMSRMDRLVPLVRLLPTASALLILSTSHLSACASHLESAAVAVLWQ